MIIVRVEEIREIDDDGRPVIIHRTRALVEQLFVSIGDDLWLWNEHGRERTVVLDIRMALEDSCDEACQLALVNVATQAVIDKYRITGKELRFLIGNRELHAKGPA